MRLCHYDDGRAGVVEGEKVYPIGDALVARGVLRPRYTMLEVVEALVADPALGSAYAHGTPLALGEVRLRAPIENPGSIWAAAANYRAHQLEMETRVGAYDRSVLGKDDLMAEFFLKPTSSIVGPGGPVVLPKISNHVDFECELCAIIGKPARRAAEENALEHVFGYLMLWDFSQRDPWSRGRHNTRNIRKGFDTFTALGPWIVTRDEIPDPQALDIDVEQNGVPVMHAHTGDMICGLREHIRFLSSVLTLRTGDLITTGTPAGVSKLAAGDVLLGRIARIGEMRIAVEAET